MKTIHPDIAGRRFSTPQGSDESFEQFLEGFNTPRQELLAELSEGIATSHGRSVPINSHCDDPAFLLELTRFIVVYQLLANQVEVCTIISKRNSVSPDDFAYFTSTVTLPAKP
jgi:hypothetical protein